MFRRFLTRGKIQSSGFVERVGFVYIDAENSIANPEDYMSSIENHLGTKPKESVAYSKWSANSPLAKKYRSAGFRLIQADSGENNADIMMSLDAYEKIRDLADQGIEGNVYICFHGDKGFTHLLEKLRAVKGWKSIWVTSNKKQNKMIANASSEVLLISSSKSTDKKPTKTIVKAPRKVRQAPPSRKNIKSNNLDFKPIILQLIQNGATNSATLGKAIIGYQGDNNWAETGKEAFNLNFGLSKTNSYVNTIKQFMSDSIDVGEGPRYTFSIKGKKQSIPKTSIPITKANIPAQNLDFKPVLLQLIQNGATNSATLGQAIIAYQEQNNWAKTGKEAFNLKFGLPNSNSYVQTIKQFMSASIDVGSGLNSTFSIKNKTQSIPKAKAKAKAKVRTPVKVSVKNLDFKPIILQLIQNGATNSATLGQAIIGYQGDNNWTETGKQAFNLKFGLTKTNSYVNTIKQFMSDSIEIEGNGPKYTFSIKDN